MARALLILECRIEYVKEGVPYKHIIDEIVWKQLRHRNPFRVEDLAHPIKLFPSDRTPCIVLVVSQSTNCCSLRDTRLPVVRAFAP